MSSKLSQMRDDFRKKLTLKPEIDKNVCDVNNNKSKTRIIPISVERKINPWNTSLNSRNNITSARSYVQITPTVTKTIGSKPSVSSVNTRTLPTVQSNRKVVFNQYSKPSVGPKKSYNDLIINRSLPMINKSKTENQDQVNAQKDYRITESLDMTAKKPISQTCRSRVTFPLKLSEKVHKESFISGNLEGTPCRFCGRYFALSERLQKHETICEPSTNKIRDKFDSTQQRFKGKPKDYIQSYEKALENPEKKEPRKSSWRTKHEYCLAAIRAAKGDTNSGPSTSQITASTQEQCEYCKRRFNENALTRHRPICAKLFHKKVMNFR